MVLHHSMSFKISMEGEGRKLKVFITERSSGFILWIHFGEESEKSSQGDRKLWESLDFSKEFCCLEVEWQVIQIGMQEEQHGEISVVLYNRRGGKRHKLFILEGRGIINGWTILTESIRLKAT